MTAFDPTRYAPLIAELLREPWTPPLDVGQPNTDARARLDAAMSDNAFAPHCVRDRAMAEACRAGLWLHHNYLDESHKISQEIHTPTGSYWHALMHRRESDFGNAKYWIRRVGTHPVYDELHRAASLLDEPAPPSAGFLRTQTAWDPFAFVDLCAEVLAGRVLCLELCRHVQKLEWQLLFDWCYCRAIEEF